MKTKFLNATLTGLFLLVACLNNVANAGLILGTNTTDWLVSTDVRDGGSGNWTTLIAEVDLPAVSTYTITPTFGGIGVVAAGIDLGVTALAAANDVHFYRSTFDLFSIQSAAVALAVDNDVQVFINGHEVAREVNLSLVNWISPYPAFDIQSDGSISNVVKFDQTFAFTGWNEGTNEVVLAVRNIANPGDAGGIAFRMDVETNTVPEPSILAIFGLGILGLGLGRIFTVRPT